MKLLRAVFRSSDTPQDIPFARDDGHRFLPWIVSFMVLLSALVLSGGLTLNSAIDRGHHTYTNTFTVQVPYQEQGMENSVRRVIGELNRVKGVKHIQRLDPEQVKQLVSPWLGSGAVLDLLPLPALIEVQTKPDNDDEKAVDLGRLRERLASLVPDVEIEDNQEWVDQYSRFTGTIRALAFLFALFIVLTTVAIIALITRTSLRLHHKTVLLLHSIGATDEYIAKQFQRNAFTVALKGALMGAVAATIVYGILVYLAQGMDAPLMPSVRFSFSHGVMLLLLPFITGGTALLAARMTVLSMLRAIP